MDRSSIYTSDRANHTIRRINVLGLWSRCKTDTVRARARWYKVTFHRRIVFLYPSAVVGTIPFVFRSPFETHSLFPSKMGKGIVSVVILSRREDASNPFTKLTSDIIFFLFQLVPYGL